MANYVYNKIVCSESFLNEYLIDYYPIRKEERLNKPYISLRKVLGLESIADISYENNGAPFSYGHGFSYEKRKDGLYEVKILTRWYYPIVSIIKSIEIDNTVKWYSFEENRVYISKFEYSYKEKRVVESVLNVGEDFEKYLAYVLDYGIEEEYKNCDDWLWHFKFSEENWVLWESKSNEELIKRYDNQKYPYFEYCEMYTSKSKEILDKKTEELVKKYKGDIFLTQYNNEEKYVNKNTGRIKGRFESCYWSELSINSKYFDKIEDATKIKYGIEESLKNYNKYNLIQVLPYNIKFESYYDELYIEEPSEDIKDSIRDILNTENKIDLKTGNIYPNYIDYIQGPKIKQFVLIREKYRGPLWGNEVLNEFYFYNFKNSKENVYLPKWIFYPSPEDNIEILEDDHILFNGIDNFMEKEVDVERKKYIGVTKAFNNFLKQCGLLE